MTVNEAKDLLLNKATISDTERKDIIDLMEWFVKELAHEVNTREISTMLASLQ